MKKQMIDKKNLLGGEKQFPELQNGKTDYNQISENNIKLEEHKQRLKDLRRYMDLNKEVKK